MQKAAVLHLLGFALRRRIWLWCWYCLCRKRLDRLGRGFHFRLLRYLQFAHEVMDAPAEFFCTRATKIEALAALERIRSDLRAAAVTIGHFNRLFHDVILLFVFFFRSAALLITSQTSSPATVNSLSGWIRWFWFSRAI